MLPEDIRNMDFGQASMPHAPEAQTPEVPYDTTTPAPDRPAIPLSPDMLSGNLRGNDSEKSGIEFSFDAFGYTQQVELVQESYADGNLAVTAYLSDPTDESFGQPWRSVTVNFGSPLQQDATVFLDTNNMGEAMLSKISQLGAFTGQFMRSGFCSYPAFTFDTEVMGNMRDLNEFASADHSSLAEMRGACHAALENVYGTKNFRKCYLMDFLTVLGIIDSRQLDVFVYIAENTNPSNNTFIGTYTKISKDVGVSSRTIAKIMKKLQENNFIKKVQNGVWLVNPNILMKGGDHKRQIP